MADVASRIGDGLWNAVLMAWEVWWALVLGFAISAIVQAWVPRERIQSALSGEGIGPIAKATGLGAASSSCSYAAIAIAKSLSRRGRARRRRSPSSSPRRTWSGSSASCCGCCSGGSSRWPKYVGGLLMIALMWGLLRVFVSGKVEEQARTHAQHADAGHQHHTAATQTTFRARLTSAQAWSDVAHNFRGDWQMLYKEITAGFLLAGFIALLGDDFFNGLRRLRERRAYEGRGTTGQRVHALPAREPGPERRLAAQMQLVQCTGARRSADPGAGWERVLIWVS
jgi:hypothetical protein